jgi:hypothetical protein
LSTSAEATGSTARRLEGLESWCRALAADARAAHGRIIALGVVLLAVGVSCADGFIGGVVAYERDTTVFYYPLLLWASQQLQAGQLPLWCPQIFAGYPIFADGELGLASPAVLLALLTLPADAASVVLRLLHVAVAAVGAYALARAWRLPRAPAALAGITFALGSFMQAHIHHENIVRTAAWLPVGLACLERGLRTCGGARTRWMLGAAGSVGLAGVGLHPEILLDDLLAITLYGLLRWRHGPIGGLTRRAGSRARAVWQVVAGGVLLGLLLAAVQLVPEAELATRAARTAAFPFSEVAGESLWPSALVQLVFPYFFRAPGHLQWGLWTHWEAYLYVGLAPLLLALVALSQPRRRGVAVWAVIGAFGLLTALGQSSPVPLFQILWSTPGLGWLRAPGRFSLLPALALAMLAAHGLAHLEARARQGHRAALLRRVGLIALAGLLPLGVLWALDAAHAAALAAPNDLLKAVDAEYLALPHDQTALTARDVYQGLLWSTDLANPRVLGCLLGLCLITASMACWQLAPWRRVRAWPGWSGVLVVGTAVDLVVFGWGIHPRQDLAALAAPEPAVTAVRRLADQRQRIDGPGRVFASPIVQGVAPDRLAALGLQEAGGYSSLDTSRQRAFLQRVQRVDDDLMDLWNIRYVLDPAVQGPLASYNDVQYFARNPLLEGPRDSDLGDEVFRLPAAFQPREIRVVSALAGAAAVPQAAAVAEITLRAADGQELGQAYLRAGVDTMDWGFDDLTPISGVAHQRVEVAGDVAEKINDQVSARRLLSYGRLAVDQRGVVSTVEIRSLAPRGELIIYGAALVDQSGHLQQLFGRHKSKFRELGQYNGVTVLENTAALPRAFLVSSARVATQGTSLSLMEDAPFAPRSEVILAATTPPANALAAGSPLDTGLSPGEVRIDSYAPQQLSMQIDAHSHAFLVVTDTFYPGWRAYVDGQEQPILRGDYLFRVIEVPAGRHQVVLRFEPASVWGGLALSLLGLGLALGALSASRLRPGGMTRGALAIVRRAVRIANST